jgi:endoglucanase
MFLEGIITAVLCNRVRILPPMNPHDRRSGADNIPEPWPGYIVGGGQNATDWLDDVKSYSTNEVAINWQAALVFALADFINY